MVFVVLAPVIIGFAWVVGRGFGYLLFKTVGAKTEIQGFYILLNILFYMLYIYMVYDIFFLCWLNIIFHQFFRYVPYSK